VNEWTIAAHLARKVFDSGCGPGGPTQRLQLMGGKYPDAEINRGGLNQDALIRLLAEGLTEVMQHPSATAEQK
jgi:trans-aconitate methyltransferase